MEQSYNQLSTLTGISYRTIKKRLTEAGLEPLRTKGKAHLFESKEALPLLYGTDMEDDKGKLERARTALADEQTRRLKRENDVEDREVIPVEKAIEIGQTVTKQASRIFDRLPVDMKRRIPHLKSKDIQAIKEEVAKAKNMFAEMRLASDR